MNLFNRGLIIFVTLAIMAILILLFLQTIQIISVEQTGISLSWMGLSDESNLRTRLTIGSICLGVFFAGAVLLYVELSPFFSAEPQYLVLKDDLGKVEISRSCVGKYIDYEARHFEGVLEANSKIINKKDGLYIRSDITVKPELKITEIGPDLQNHIKSEIQGKLGLYVSEIAITAHFVQKDKPDRNLA